LKNFDPNSLERYCVIAFPHKFQGETYEQRKIFVVLGHKDSHAICLKTTSKTDSYKNNKDAMAGVVFYAAGELSVFPSETVIQTDNCVPIPHVHLIEAKNNFKLEVFPVLPQDFHDRIKQAVNNSVTLDDRKRLRLCHILGF
jgi:hypothetical protein